MSFGVDISDSTLKEPDKKDWVCYEGVMMPKMSAAGKKRWATVRKNMHYKKYKCLSKEDQREIIIGLLIKSEKEWMIHNHERYTAFGRRNIIILETPELLFLKKLDEKYKEQIPFEVWIPNNIEFEKFEHEDFCNACKGNIYGEHQIKGCSSNWYDTRIKLLNLSYLEFIKRKETYFRDEFSTSLIWADYCGAFSSYTEDIEETFSSMILGNHSYYAITFCKRDPKRNEKLKQYKFTNCIIAVNDFVSKTAKKYGYTAEILPESSMYKTNMFTAIFLIKYTMMEEHKDEITKVIEEHRIIEKQLRQKLETFDILIRQANRLNDLEKCDECGKYCKDVMKHKVCSHGWYRNKDYPWNYLKPNEEETI